MCIELGIPATRVAEELGVSRMTVYNWFWGESTPSRENSEQIKLFMARYKEHK
jgi:predicted transcriptional regulator